MNRIILHGGIANCYEFLEPCNDLLDHVSNDDGFTVALCELPTSLSAELLFFLCFSQRYGLDVATTDCRQIKPSSEVIVQGIQSLGPEVL